MKKRALLIVLDSVGCGDAPDAGAYGDCGANTLGHLLANVPSLRLPTMHRLGLGRLIGDHQDTLAVPRSAAFRLSAEGAGKDTTTGHWELMNCPVLEPFYTCKQFPRDLVVALEERCGVRFIGNKAASGTVILDELGSQHLETGNPILYTSADSVLQIAAHEEGFGLTRLYEICEMARSLLDEMGIRVGRVIARPFLGSAEHGFKRTGNRHDYSLTPGSTTLNLLENRGVSVVGVGKIADIFAGSGIGESYPTKTNSEGMMRIDKLWERPRARDEFIFVNLVDFDSLYGHRRDPLGYARCLEEFDEWLGRFLEKIGPEDLVMITADHGNDPYAPGTDHTREQVPCLAIGPEGERIRGLKRFSDVGRCIERYFTGNENLPDSQILHTST